MPRYLATTSATRSGDTADEWKESTDADDDSEVEYSLQSLGGFWQDTKGSSYEVLVDRSGVEIRTSRPNGKVITTRGLVFLDQKTGWIVWGRSGAKSQYWLSTLTSSSMCWERAGSAPFHWHRTGWPEESSEAAELENDEHEAEESAAWSSWLTDGRHQGVASDWRGLLTGEVVAAVGGHEEQSCGRAAGSSKWRVVNKQDAVLEQPQALKDEAQLTLRKLLGMRDLAGDDSPAVASGDAGYPAHSDGVQGTSLAETPEDLQSMPSTSASPRAPMPPQMVAPLLPEADLGRFKKADDLAAADSALLAALKIGGARMQGGSPPRMRPGDRQMQMPPIPPMPPMMQVAMQGVPGLPGPYGHMLPTGLPGHAVGPTLPMMAAPPACGAPVAPQWPPLDPLYVVTQLQHYFSDSNLAMDEILRRSMILGDGWVALQLLESLPSLHIVGANVWALRQACASVPDLELDGTASFVRIMDPVRRRRWVSSGGVASR